jgi:tetratricopeptide (TPR) repeat protein
MTWKPSNEPTRYDRARVERTDTIDQEIKKLRLPPIRQRKLNGILNALIMQIEDGGDSPEVNRLLLEALRAAVRHQVGERRARSVLEAIDRFGQVEDQRWEMVKAGTLPPIELRPEERLDDLMLEGYGLLDAGQRTAACDKWLEAWQVIKELLTPEMRTAMDFDTTYPTMHSAFNWASDLEMELGNAGLDDPAYHEHRVRYVREFLTRFPDEDANRHVNFRRAEAEALWQLGKQAEAEAVYQALVGAFPDEGWAYIGWSDEYYLWHQRAKDYEKGEAILLRALEQPDLEDRTDVLDRLVSLYEEWGQQEKRTQILTELNELGGTGRRYHSEVPAKLVQAPEPHQATVSPSPPPKRNAPCWCGSGKKYKFCHMHSDRQQKRSSP